jgi:hypothetical protein
MKQVKIGNTREVVCRVGVGFYPLFESEDTLIEVDSPNSILVCVEKLEPNDSLFHPRALNDLTRDQKVAAIMRRVARGETTPRNAVKWVELGWRIPTDKEVIDARKEIQERTQPEPPEPEPPADPAPPSRIRQWIKSMTLIELIIVLTIVGLVLAAVLPR